MAGQESISGPGRQWDALVVHPDDDVAVTLRDVQVGTTVEALRAGAVIRVEVTENIPLGHKFALRVLAQGTQVRKYGECIGVAIADIACGAHVHVHNITSRRALGTK